MTTPIFSAETDNDFNLTCDVLTLFFFFPLKATVPPSPLFGGGEGNATLREIVCFEMLATGRFLRALLSKPGGDSSVFLTSGVWEEIIACLLKLPLGFSRE